MKSATHKHVTGDGAVKASGGALVAVTLSAAVGAAGTLILYDNPSAASGTILWQGTALAGDTVTFCPSAHYPAANGIYADIGGASATATIVYY